MSTESCFGPEGFDESEEELIVPSYEAVLEVPRPLARDGNDLSDPDKSRNGVARTEAVFKEEVLQIAQALRLHGWDKVQLDCSINIDVKKLSGATTNAVYVISPPITPNRLGAASGRDEVCLPRKVLLRIYGAQTEYLIDRQAEIHILGRLAQKRLGPRVLGIFTNGRFEEYFSARPLTVAEMCETDTSVHIAEQLRELHDGFALNQQELDAGPFIWCIWDKWVARCERVCTALDNEILRSNQTVYEGRGNNWRERGLVCGTEWDVFSKTVKRYRDFLSKKYNGPAGTRTRLVFAHNDVKYDNVLRLEPTEESLLAQRSNPLVLIDFEYSGANIRGFDFANHFTEWCYDYNHKEDPTAFRENLYPTVREQRRFVEAYAQHTPGVQTHNSDNGSPVLDFQDPERKAEQVHYAEVDRLLEETRLWRAATSVLWVAWAIVQANLEKELAEPRLDNGVVVKKTLVGDEAEQEEGPFDYLGCAQDRALVFWGDVVSLGIISVSDLPEKLRKRIKFCNDSRV